MWRNFRFQYKTDVEKSEISPHVEEFQIFHTTDVGKSEILLIWRNSTHDRCGEICFVAIYAIFPIICFVEIYALLRGEKLSQKLYPWRKNDKYEVC